ncbi:hypothetical protein LL06_13095 [Hoeflea sp. BAL378]|nr:hypothetical protein LL06_13095 [Hoeflea sp. BAL378]
MPVRASYAQAGIACAAFTGVDACLKPAGGLPIFATVLLGHSFSAAFLLPIRSQRERWEDVWIIERALLFHARAAHTARAGPATTNAPFNSTQLAWGTVRRPRLSRKAVTEPPEPH